MINQLIEWDKALFLTLNGLGVSWLDQPMILFSTIWLWIPLYAIIAFLLFKKFALPQAVIFMAALIVGVVITDQGSYWLFKEQFQRLRPCQEEDLLAQMRFLADYCGLYGFISSHAANTFGFAVIAGGIFNTTFPKMKTGLLIWAAVVSYSRIYIGVHYPLDIICGALFGILSGKLVLMIIKTKLPTTISSKLE